MCEEDIKNSADVICLTLSTNGLMTLGKLEEFTGYNEKQVFKALRWLMNNEKIGFIEKSGLIYVEAR